MSIDPNETISTMSGLANGIDSVLNSGGLERKSDFILLVFPVGDADERCNSVSSVASADVIVLLKKLLAKLEGMPNIAGHG